MKIKLKAEWNNCRIVNRTRTISEISNQLKREAEAGTGNKVGRSLIFLEMRESIFVPYLLDLAIS